MAPLRELAQMGRCRVLSKHSMLLLGVLHAEVLLFGMRKAFGRCQGLTKLDLRGEENPWGVAQRSTSL